MVYLTTCDIYVQYRQFTNMAAGRIIETREPKVADPCVRGSHSGECIFFCFILTPCILVELLRLQPPLSGYATLTVEAAGFSETSVRCYVQGLAASHPIQVTVTSNCC